MVAVTEITGRRTVGSFDEPLGLAGGVLTVPMDAHPTIGSTELTEATTVAFTGLRVGGRATLQVDGNNQTLTFPDSATIVRGQWEPQMRNIIRVEQVTATDQIVDIHSFLVPTLTVLFHHDVAGGVFGAGDDPDDINAGSADPLSETKYSILSTLETFRRATGEFRLRLEYPNGEWIVWEQTSNPVANRAAGDTTQQGAGFALIEWSSPDVIGAGTAQPFGGLAWSVGALAWATYDGNPNQNPFWYAVGLKQLFAGGLPGYVGSTGNYVAPSITIYAITEGAP
jgi:hypothetical protein